MKTRTIAALLALSSVSLAGLTTGAQAIEPLPPLPSGSAMRIPVETFLGLQLNEVLLYSCSVV